MATIQFRRDTEANWEAANPVLADGEPGYTEDTGVLKVGDGTSKWAELPGFINEDAIASTFARLDSIRHMVTIDDLPTEGPIYGMHRGSSRVGRPVAPEESASAYRIAVAQGAVLLDVDYHITKDGVMVAAHDDALSDLAQGSTGNVSDYQSWLLPPLSQPTRIGMGWAPEPFLPLEDLLAEFGGRALVTIQPKNGADDLPMLTALIHKYGLERSVLLNSPDTSVIAAIVAAGCTAHSVAVNNMTNATLDGFKAAGATIAELPQDAPSALVDYAVSLGFGWLLYSPITMSNTSPKVNIGLSTFTQVAALDPRVPIIACDAVGYLNRPGGEDQPSATSIAPAIAAGRVGAGWATQRNSNSNTTWLPADGSGIVLRDGTKFCHLWPGDLAGQRAESGSITLATTIATAPTSDHIVNLRALLVEEGPYVGVNNGSDITNDTYWHGYCAGIRSNGTIALVRTDAAGGVTLSSITGTALTVGTEYAITFEWTPTQVRLTRTDTGDTTGWINDATYRGNYMGVFNTYTDGRILLTGLSVAE